MTRRSEKVRWLVFSLRTQIDVTARELNQISSCSSLNERLVCSESSERFHINWIDARLTYLQWNHTKGFCRADMIFSN